MKLGYEEFPLDDVRTYPLTSRASKVDVSQFRAPYPPGGSVQDWLASLPSILAADDLRAVAAAIGRARAPGARRVGPRWATSSRRGSRPVLADLMARGFVSAVALNGAAMIHDFEIAIGGRTSEDVDAALGPGNFGMAEETATWLNQAINAGVADGQGTRPVGRGVPARQRQGGVPRRQPPVRRGAGTTCPSPCTWPSAPTSSTCTRPRPARASARAACATSAIFTSAVARLAGGVFLNCGSAVVLPEVFLKAVALARNRGISLDGLTTVNLDFIRHYRPMTNVVNRPTSGVGKGLLARRAPRVDDSADCRRRFSAEGGVMPVR